MSRLTKQELFDQWFQKIGLGERWKYNNKTIGRFIDESSFDKLTSESRRPFEKIIEIVLASDEVSNQPPIYFDFLNNNYLGAYATISTAGDEFIAINQGTNLLMIDIFSRLLSHPHVFPWIGDPNKERRNLPPIRTLYVDHEKLYYYGDLNYEAYQIVKPIDQVRQDYATLLFKLALDFLAFHEINHLVRGHIGYLKSLNGTHTISEINSTKISLDITVPTLEWDADQTAAKVMLINTIKAINNPSLAGQVLMPFYQNAEEAIFNLLTAIYFLLRVMGPGKYDLNNLKSLTHAPPRVRQHMIFNTIEETLSRFSELKKINLEKIIERVVGDSELAVGIITEYGFEVDSIIDAYKDESYSYINEIVANWKVIYPELQNFSRMKLYNYYFVRETSIPRWVM